MTEQLRATYSAENQITSVLLLEWEEEKEIFGESLPAGLSIAAQESEWIADIGSYA
jgi:hypothetical protein